MSSSYKLLYNDRRQFIFEETEETHSTAILTLVAGFIGGSLLGVYFSSLDLTTAGSILLAVGTYVTVITSTFSLRTNPLSVAAMFVTSLTAVVVLIYLSRVTLEYFKESRIHMVLVYAGLFAILAEVLYLWSRVTWVEDSRMHQLIEISEVSTNKSGSKQNEVPLSSFFRWIGEILKFCLFRLYFWLMRDPHSGSKYPVLFIESLAKWSEADKAKKISIRNDTLKRVKICVYHKSDYCCWVPVGGLTGGMYELDRGETLTFSPHWPSSAFRVKVFAHGMIDYELAANPNVVRGKFYAFIDVAKPITILPSMSPPSTTLRGMTTNEPSSSEDDENDGAAAIFFEDSVAINPEPLTSSTGGGLRRVPSSRVNLSRAGSAPTSPQGYFGSPLPSPSAIRRGFKQHLLLTDLIRAIAVLNETTTDIKVSFYNIEDTSFVRSLDSFGVMKASTLRTVNDKLVIPKGEWKIFELLPQEPSREKFCLRVRMASVPGTSSANAMELSYCTAYLGDVLVIRDPIVTI